MKVADDLFFFSYLRNKKEVCVVENWCWRTMESSGEAVAD